MPCHPRSVKIAMRTSASSSNLPAGFDEILRHLPVHRIHGFRAIECHERDLIAHFEKNV